MQNTEKTEQIELELDLEPLEAEKKDDDLVIEEVKEPEVQVKQPELTVEDGINELKTRLEEERRAREDAERRYREAQELANAAKMSENDSNMRLIENAIETVKRNQEILKQNLEDAVAAGDVRAQADIMLNIQNLNSDFKELLKGKEQYENYMKQSPKPLDPVEEVASRLSKPSADWVRAHPEYARNPALMRRMIVAHEDALEEGHKVDTDEYFASVEAKLKIRKPETNIQQEESALSEAANPTQRRSAPPAAPVSRQATNNSGTKPNVVRLTSAEREIASSIGMTDREYAIQKQALIKAGKMAG